MEDVLIVEAGEDIEDFADEDCDESQGGGGLRKGG